jgi:hypothetical protein
MNYFTQCPICKNAGIFTKLYQKLFSKFLFIDGPNPRSYCLTDNVHFYSTFHWQDYDNISRTTKYYDYFIYDYGKEIVIFKGCEPIGSLKDYEIDYKNFNLKKIIEDIELYKFYS